MKNVLVTGGAGFIGSNFIHFLLEHEPECQIHNLDVLTYSGSLENLRDIEKEPRYHFIKGDICDTKNDFRVLEQNKMQKTDQAAHLNGPWRTVKRSMPHTLSE